MIKIFFTIILSLISATAFTIDYWYFPLENDRAVISKNMKTGEEYFEKCKPFEFIGFMIRNEGVIISVEHGGIRIDVERSPEENKNKAWTFIILTSKAECDKYYKQYYPIK